MKRQTQISLGGMLFSIGLVCLCIPVIMYFYLRDTDTFSGPLEVAVCIVVAILVGKLYLRFVKWRIRSRY